MRLLVLTILLSSAVAHANNDDGTPLVDVGLSGVMESWSDPGVSNSDGKTAGWMPTLALSLNVGPWVSDDVAIIAHLGVTTPRLVHGHYFNTPDEQYPNGEDLIEPMHYLGTELGVGVEMNFGTTTIAPWVGIAKMIGWGNGTDDLPNSVSLAFGVQLGTELYADGPNHLDGFVKLTYAPWVGSDELGPDDSAAYTQVGIGLAYRYR